MPPVSQTFEHELVRILADAASPAEAGTRLLELTGRHFGWTVGTLWIVDHEAGLIRSAASWSTGDPGAEDFRQRSSRLTFSPGLGLPGRVWQTGELEWVDDFAATAAFPRAAAAAAGGLHGAVGTPVMGPAGILGVIEFLGPESRAPEPGQLDLLRLVGRQVGQYVARVHAEERLRATEEISASIVQAALDCIITMDHRGRVLSLNPAAESVFGYMAEEAIGRPLADLMIPLELRDAHREGLARYLETGEARILDQRLELTGLRADGTRIPVELTITRLGHDEAPVFAGFVRDITTRRESDKEVARLLEREREARVRAEDAERSTRRVAEALQRSLLPPHLPRIPGLELGAAYRSGAAGTMVGGDFYDVFELGGGRWGIAIGDVRGKGAYAASVTALMRYTIRTAAIREPSPSAVLQALNAGLISDTAHGDFCTAIYAELDVSGQPRLRLSIGGHPLPLVRAANGKVRAIGRPGTLLGAVREPTLENHEVELAEGDLLLLFTDGLIESRTPDGFFGTERLAVLLGECAGMHANAAARHIESVVVDSPAHEANDDVALLTLRANAARRHE